MPSTIYLVTGGVRSGKSSYAQHLCERLISSNNDNDNRLTYVATAGSSNTLLDDNFRKRIQKHRADRGEQWTTIEEPLYPSKFVDKFHGKVVLVDCLTLWLTNFMIQEGAFEEAATEETGDDDNNDEQTTTTTTNNNNLKDPPKDDHDDDKKKKAPPATTEPEPEGRALDAIRNEFDKLTDPWDVTYVFVTNEIGSGIHASTPMTRNFVDLQGWFNQYVADRADRVTFMVCGQPCTVKQYQQQSDPRSPLTAIPNTQQMAEEAAMVDKYLSKRSLTMDDKGYFLISVDHKSYSIVVKFYSCIVNEKGEVCDLDGKKIPCHGTNRAGPMQSWTGRTAKELTVKVFEQWECAASGIVSVGHASYVGREVQRAEQCLYSGEYYQQD